MGKRKPCPCRRLSKIGPGRERDVPRDVLGFYQGQMRPDATYVRYPGVQFLETESRVAAARGRGSGTCGVV